MLTRELAISLIGDALGQLFGPLSLPPDEYFPNRNKIAACCALPGNECVAVLIVAAGLDGVDFAGDDYAGFLSVLEAAVAMVERSERVAG